MVFKTKRVIFTLQSRKTNDMKTTAKEYLSKSEQKSKFNQLANEAENTSDFDTYFKMQKKADEIKGEYFDKIDTVAVSFSIGSRSYYEHVVKIGKSYFKHGRKMTKSRGYYCISEIEEITDKMSHDMMADSYYY